VRSAEDAALAALEGEAVVQALRTLSRRQREAVVLRWFLHLTEAEMAAAMGVSTGSVKAYASRGLDELGRRLEEGS
jgi:RNA polymerase sigma factor (sigma-70 family)